MIEMTVRDPDRFNFNIVGLQGSDNLVDIPARINHDTGLCLVVKQNRAVLLKQSDWYNACP